MDADYLDRLSPEERAFAEEFYLRYYLHEARDKDRKKLRTARDVADRDIVTASAADIARALEPSADGNLRKRGCYSADDYNRSPQFSEDALNEALDAEKEDTP